jgi:hypothetical protein
MKASKKAVFKPVTYRLANNRFGESVLIKVGRNKKLTIFDSDKGYNRAIRHCPNEKSIFLDEQSEHALVAPIIFEFGQFVIEKESQLITKEFLEAHPSNVSNGGTWFEVVDEEGDSQEFVDIEEIQLDLKQLVRTTAKEEDGIYELEAVVSVLRGRYIGGTMTMAELKSAIYQQIDEDYTYFMDDSGKNITLFEDSYIKMKFLGIRAIDEGIIQKDPRTKSILWSDNKERIYQAPAGTRLMDSFAEFLMTEDGMLVGKEIANRS